MRFTWLIDPDEPDTLWCRFIGPDGQEVAMFIDRRPSYCDRGHYKFVVWTGIGGLDGADSFPRYYMGLRTAIREATLWAAWRLWKVSPLQVVEPRTLAFYDGFDINLPEINEHEASSADPK